MQWVVPEHPKSAVDEAGEVLASPTPVSNGLDRALVVINNWRASHHFPLNTFQSTLRRKSAEFPGAVVVQRIKRLRAIQHKLRKHTKKPIPLSIMQDIGGCRAVLRTSAHLRKLHKAYLDSDFKHELINQDDYITSPRYSGYRGIHLIYAYKSDRKSTYNGLKIEVQLRTQLQHAWATAVEIVGFFRKELLKSSEGDSVWKHFFKLMAANIAFEEKAAFGIPDIPWDRKQLRDQLRRCADRLNALSYLRTIGAGVEDVVEVDTSGAHYFLLDLDTVAKHLKVTGYKLNARGRATLDYAVIERTLLNIAEHDAVLVSAESMAHLKRAYVNYFLDMRRFIEIVEVATAS